MNVYQFKVVSILILLLLLSACSEGSKCVVESSKEELTYSDDGSEDVHYMTCTGSLNGDEYRDSVVVELGSGNAFLSIFFGTMEGEYKLFKRYLCEHYWEELGLDIHGDTLSCYGYGISYNFLYTNGDFKLVSYQSFTTGNPLYLLDFDKNEMTFVLETNDGISGETTYRTMDIPQDKIPDSCSITNAFKEKFRRYICYDETFLYSKIEEFVNEINDEAKKPQSKRIDNDTLLSFSEEINYGEKTFALYMSIDRKGLTPTLEKIFETEMCAMLDKENKHVYSNISEAYEARKDEWLRECDFENESYCYIDDYFIKKIGSRNDLSTYRLGTFHNDQYSGRGLEDERYITYNKNTGMPLTWDLVKKEEGLHTLMVEGLMKYFDSNSVENMYLMGKYQKGEFIPFPKNPPFIVNDSLVLQFHRFEITDTWGAGWPCATISLDEVIPYLTDEGKDFLLVNIHYE